MSDPDGMELEFTGDIWHWRGPAPYYFVSLPDEESSYLYAVCPAVTYGWGMILVQARIGGTEWRTSLFPKNGSYILPVKVAVRRAESIDEGDTVEVRLQVRSAN